jgi:hypothetical protein
MTTANTSTVIALFESRTAAERAIDGLLAAGFSRDQLSVITGDTRATDNSTPDLGPIPSVGSGVDAGTGAAVGGLAGFIGGIIALAIPGIGPALAVGPLAAGIMGAGIGAATGGLAGVLKGHGVPESHAERMTEAIRRGRVLISAHVPHERVDAAAAVLEDHGAIDVDEPDERLDATATSSTTSTGETRFPPLSPEAVEAARLKPGEGMVDKYVRGGNRRVNVYPGFTGMGPASNT